MTVVAILSTILHLVTPAFADDSSARFDGPAELPHLYMKTSLADTPAPGKTQFLKAGGNLQATLDHISCGDTLALEAGASFTGRFVLPQKNCDDSHWIIIRTSADSELPPEGSRLTPCYAGIASLPGRPDFHCISTKNVLPKLIFEGKAGGGPIVFASGANHYRLVGLEITRSPGESGVTSLIGPEVDKPAHHIILDRLWVHGTPQDETRRGLFLTDMNYVAVVDSFFTDFHCVSITGSCTDSQTIVGGMGDVPGGPYKIVNNFLEAAGENIMLGGGKSTVTPSDIEIRHNYLFKPLIWKPNQPGFVGGSSGKPFVVKNLFELKNAQRLLFEGNVLDNNWGGVGQRGFAIVLTPRNQTPNVCPLCRVTDVTIRYCKVRHIAAGMNIVNGPSDTGGVSTAGERYSIHDVIFQDIDRDVYNGFGFFAMIISNAPQLRDVRIDHVTAFPQFAALSIGAHRDQPLPVRISITNSILAAADHDVNAALGGPQNCALGRVAAGPEAMFAACFDGITFKNNVIIAPNAHWPSGNSFPKNPEAVGFVNYSHGRDGDYRLCHAGNEPPSCKQASQYVHKGSDGRDPGADVEAVEAATRGAE